MNVKIDPGVSDDAAPKSRDVHWQAGEITRRERELAQGHAGAVVWFTGLSGSGKSTIAIALEAELFRRGVRAYRLDGDNLRHGLCGDLGFSPADRAENIRRAGEVVALFADAGVVTLASFISPYAEERRRARVAAGDAVFLEVFVDCPLAECERRDPKSLYKKARAGKIPDFTGISAPYEAPAAPDLHIRSDQVDVGGAVAAIVGALAQRRVLR